MKQLHDAGILAEDLAIPDDLHDLEVTYRGLCRLPHVDTSRRRRIDILCVPWVCRGSARLYYTVSYFRPITSPAVDNSVILPT